MKTRVIISPSIEQRMIEARQTSVPWTGDLRRVVSEGKGDAAEEG